MIQNASFYQSAATAFLALLGAGIFAESRERASSGNAQMHERIVAGAAPAETPGDAAEMTDSDRQHGPELLRGVSLSRRIGREAGFTLLLGLTFGLGEILCLIVLANNTAHGWQLGLISYSLIIGLILTVSFAFGSVLSWRVPEFSRRARRRLEVAVIAILTAGAAVFLLVSIINKRQGFGSFSQPALPAGYYFVQGTCADGRCGLTEREAPGRSDHPTGRIWSDNDILHVVCQVRGARFTGAGGSTSAVWDKLADGSYVTDVFVETPGRGTFSPTVKRCPNQPGKASG